MEYLIALILIICAYRIGVQRGRSVMKKEVIKLLGVPDGYEIRTIGYCKKGE